MDLVSVQNKQIFEKNWQLGRKYTNNTNGTYGHVNGNGLHTNQPGKKVYPELMKIPRYSDLIGIINEKENETTSIIYIMCWKAPHHLLI